MITRFRTSFCITGSLSTKTRNTRGFGPRTPALVAVLSPGGYSPASHATRVCSAFIKQIRCRMRCFAGRSRVSPLLWWPCVKTQKPGQNPLLTGANPGSSLPAPVHIALLSDASPHALQDDVHVKCHGLHPQQLRAVFRPCGQDRVVFTADARSSSSIIDASWSSQ
jgi:hypothetical protein